jgi:hypothetical protein
MTKKTNIICSIDPGSRDAGFAFFREEQFRNTELLALPVYAGVAHTGKRDLTDRCEDLANQIFSNPRRIVHIYCEEPKIFGGGLGFAAKDSALELMFFAGYIARIATSQQARFAFVSIQKWKGNMPKELTAKRIEKLWLRHCPLIDPYDRMTRRLSHDWDAVGIGFHAQGFNL